MNSTTAVSSASGPPTNNRHDTMADQSSSRFSTAYNNLRKAADANPEFFTLARDVHKRTDDGSVLLMHALLEGLKEAYEAGRAGKPVPQPKLVQPIANVKKHFAGDGWRGDPEPAPVAPRVSRRPAPAAQPAPAARRAVRGAPR